MKVSQLGLTPDIDPNGDTSMVKDTSDNEAEEGEFIEGVDPNTGFTKLCTIDYQFKDYKVQNYGTCSQQLHETIVASMEELGW